MDWIKPLNVELNPICHLLALLEAHRIFHISGLRVNVAYDRYVQVAIFWECNCKFSCFMKFAEYLDWAGNNQFPIKHSGAGYLMFSRRITCAKSDNVTFEYRLGLHQEFACLLRSACPSVRSHVDNSITGESISMKSNSQKRHRTLSNHFTATQNRTSITNILHQTVDAFKERIFIVTRQIFAGIIFFFEQNSQKRKNLHLMCSNYFSNFPT